MKPKTFWHAGRSALAGFFADRRANISVIFALVAIAICGLTGAVIEYGNAADVKVRVQNALDAAVLSVASVNGTLDTTKARAVFSANFSLPNATADTPVFTQDTTTGTITASVTAHVTTSFGGIIGVNTIDIRATSTGYSEFPKVITQATFGTSSASGAYDKEIYFVLKNASGVITSRTKVLDYNYRYGQSPSVILTPSTSSSTTISVGSYDSYYVEMLVYEDLTYRGVRGSSTFSLYSNASNASTFLRTTGACSDPAGMSMNWEDGGDSNFADFVSNMKCVLTSTGTIKVRISG